MKKSLIILYVFVLLAGCSKKDDAVAPDAGTAVAGMYNVSKVTYDRPGTASDYSYTLPTSQGGKTVSATLVATRKSEKMVGLFFTQKSTGQPDEVVDFGEAELRANGSNYDMYEGTLKVGTVVSNILTLDVTDGVDRYIIISQK